MSRIAAQNNKNYAMASHPQRISPTDLSYTFPTNHLELGPTIDTFDFGRDGLRASFSSTGTGTGSESTTSEGPITPVTSTTTFDRSDLALKEYTFPQKTPVEPGRKHIRKLPPRLTESLENLALTLHISTSPSSAPTNLWELDEMYEYTVDKPLPITPKGSLEMPDRKVDQEPTRLVSQRSMPSIRGLSRRSTLKKGTARPSTAPIRHLGSRRHQHAESSASSATSNNLVTPSSSVPRASASICSEQCSRFEETNWTLYNEVHRADLDAAARKGKETRREKKERKRAEEEAFDADALPAMTNLYEAANVEIIGENGQRIAFGDLVRERTTIVIFIRHCESSSQFLRSSLTPVGFCPLCAQYMDSILSQVRPGALEEADVGLIIIGNGSGKMLPAYKSELRSLHQEAPDEVPRQSLQVPLPNVHRPLPPALQSSWIDTPNGRRRTRRRRRRLSRPDRIPIHPLDPQKRYPHAAQEPRAFLPARRRVCL